MKSLLRATPFKMFMLLAGIPVAIFLISFPIAMISFLNSNAASFSRHNENVANFQVVVATSTVLSSAYVVFLMYWLYTLGIGLTEIVQENMRPDSRLFRVCIAAPVIYLIFSIGLMFLFTNGDLFDSFAPALIIFGLLRYLVLACVIYCAFVITRMLKSIEANCDVKFEAFAGEFFLLVFFPIGIWYLQPRIKALFEGQPA